MAGWSIKDIYPDASAGADTMSESTSGSEVEAISGFPVIVWLGILIVLIAIRVLYEVA